MLPDYFQSDVSLQSANTFGIAASARYYLRLTDVVQLPLLMQQPEWQNLPRFILGGGSNVILTRDFPGIVLHVALKGREKVAEDAQFIYVRVAAGEVWHDFVQWTLVQGWGGLENLSLIPGSAGAAPIQNIGAYGVEVKDYFHSLLWFEFATGKTRTLTKTECEFAYRDSLFKQTLREKGLILEVTFALPKQWKPRLDYGDIAKSLHKFQSPDPHQISRAIVKQRQSKLPDPERLGNVGSFFKNPVVSAETGAALTAQFPNMASYPQSGGNIKLAAGWLIEQAGWKGRDYGRVGVYEKQALVVVNRGGATGVDVVCIAQAIQHDVMRQFGVPLEIEPVLI